MASRPQTLCDIPGLVAFYDPFDSKTINPSGGPIQMWDDESVIGGARPGGTPVRGTQSIPEKQPTYSATALNGKPAVNANGSQYLELAPITGLPIGQTDVTMFALLQAFDNQTGNQVVMSWGSGNGGVEHLFGFGNNGPHWWYTDRGGGSGDFHGTTDVTAGPSLCILTLDATGNNLAIEMQVNGIVEATGNGAAASFGSDGGRLFYTINDYCHPANCSAGALGVYNRRLSTDEKQRLQSILLTRQNLANLMQNDNPYKASPPMVSTGSSRRRLGRFMCS